MVGTIGTLEKGVQDLITLNLGSLAGVQGSMISASQNRGVKSVLVTSCNRREGKTVTAIGMAYALSRQSNADTLLIDGSFRDPKIHDHFNVSIDPGLSDFLTGKASLEDALRRTEDDRLNILPHGASSVSLSDLYRSEDFEKALASFKQNYDYVIYDGTSVFGGSDASTIARSFDGIIMVVECERTRWEVLQDAKDRIEKAGGKILGVVLNKRRFYIPKAFYSGG